MNFGWFYTWESSFCLEPSSSDPITEAFSPSTKSHSLWSTDKLSGFVLPLLNGLHPPFSKVARVYEGFTLGARVIFKTLRLITSVSAGIETRHFFWDFWRLSATTQLLFALCWMTDCHRTGKVLPHRMVAICLIRGWLPGQFKPAVTSRNSWESLARSIDLSKWRFWQT